MKARISFGLIGMVIFILGISHTTRAQTCEPDGDVSFICGTVSPEDLLSVPESPWVIVSSMEDEGHLYKVDVRTHIATALFPIEDSKFQHDTENYGDCPGPVTRQFRPHGLSLRPENDQVHILYVVGHGDRESVEIFKLTVDSDQASATWVGCVIAPDEVNLNSVTALPGGGFAATHFRTPLGEVWEWQPTHGWTKVPGSESNGPNGLLVSPDGNWFYIGGHGTQSVLRLSRGQDLVQQADVGVGFQVDNLRWASDGSIIAAGQASPGDQTIRECIIQGDCEGFTSRVARINAQTLSSEEIVSYPSTKDVVLGTGAIQVENEIWLGAVGGGDRIARFSIP